MATEANVTFEHVGAEIERAPVIGGWLYRTTTIIQQENPQGMIVGEFTQVTTNFVPDAAQTNG